MGGGAGARPAPEPLPRPACRACHRGPGASGRFRAGPRLGPADHALGQRGGHLFPTGQPVREGRAALPGRRRAGEVEGWGECAALPGPRFSAEYTAGAQACPSATWCRRSWRAGAACVAAVGPALAGVKGHNMAKAAFEAAVLDAELRAGGCAYGRLPVRAEPHGGCRRRTVCRRCGRRASPGRWGSCSTRSPSGWTRATGGSSSRCGRAGTPSRSPPSGNAGPSWCCSPTPTVPTQRLPIGRAADRLAPLDAYGLACLEQPLGDDDLAGHAELARQLRTPLCLDEALSSAAAVVASALRTGACSVVNIKAGRMGGYLEAVRAHDLCAERQVPVWCGGMVETGIARAANLALASLPNFSLPGDLSATGRFFETDLTSPLPLRPDGTIAVPEGRAAA